MTTTTIPGFTTEFAVLHSRSATGRGHWLEYSAT
jgi:hypothetical protein